MATQQQIDANRENATLSTGPKSAEGKKIVSGNRLSHGILSNKLLLENESPQEYQALLDDLLSQLKPVGALEQSLVEKIALILWRQKRLVRAETATITMASNDKQIASTVGSGLGLSSYGADSIEVKDLQSPDMEQLGWCKTVISEYHAADELTPDNLQQQAPLIYDQLANDAEENEETIVEYQGSLNFQEFLSELISWCHQEMWSLEKKAERYPAVVAMVETARDKLSIPWGRLDTLNKYQAALDNQLFKTMKALRDAQEWRLESLEADATTIVTEADSEAA